MLNCPYQCCAISIRGLIFQQTLIIIYFFSFSSNLNNTNNNQQALPQSTSATNRGLLSFSEFSDAEMAGYRLRCSVWIIFILATGFVAAARFYFDHQVI